MPIKTAKSETINAINDLGIQDDMLLHDRSKLLMREVEKKLEEIKSSEHGIRDAISKIGKKAVGATSDDRRIQESLVDLGAIRLSTFIMLNQLSPAVPEDIKKTAEKTLSSLTFPSNIKHLQENLRIIFGIEE